MSRLVKCEDVAVGDRLRYLGREFVVSDVFTDKGVRVAVCEDGRSLQLRDGWTVWAMEDQQ